MKQKYRITITPAKATTSQIGLWTRKHWGRSYFSTSIVDMITKIDHKEAPCSIAIILIP